MRSVRMWPFLLAMLFVQGCAGTPSLVSPADVDAMHALPLFNAHAQPRFDFYLACVSEDASCVTVEHAFSRWADDRRVFMRRVEPGDASFRQGAPSARRATVQPYRVAVRFTPLLIPSFNIIAAGRDGNMVGGYEPPKVEYDATIYVFDASGRLLRQLPVHEQRIADFKSDANSYLRAETRGLIVLLDPHWQRD